MEKSIDLLKSIINSNNERRPDINDKRWTKVEGKDYFVLPSSKHYSISDKLLKIMHKYSDIYKKIKGVEKDDVIKKLDDNIAIIYLMESSKTDEKYVGYSKNPLYTFIKLNIHKYNLDQDNVFDNFNDTDLTHFSFEIIEFVKFNQRSDIIERRRKYTEEYVAPKEDTDENVPITKAVEIKKFDVEELDKIFEKRMEIFFEVLGTQVTKFKSFKGYVYKLENTKNNKVFIGGYDKKLTKQGLINFLLQNEELIDLIKDIKRYGRRSFKLDIIDRYDAKTLFDFLIRIDFFKIKYGSVTNGYNQGFSLSESEDLFSQRLLTRKKRIMSRNIFLKIQKYLFDKNFKDDNKYDNVYGFVYQIQHKKNKMRFIDYVYSEKLKNVILAMYDDALKGNVKHSKILKAFEDQPYDAFTYKVVKKKGIDDKTISLEDTAENLIIEYDAINKGYNMDKKSMRKNIIRSNMGKRAKDGK